MSGHNGEAKRRKLQNAQDDAQRLLMRPSFTTEAKPLLSRATLQNQKNDALRILFIGELLPRVLRFGGPGLISHLRGVSDCRDAMDGLADDVKRELGLPVLETTADMETIVKRLRPVLTLPLPASCPKAWGLTELGSLAMAASPLTSERALLNMIRPDCRSEALLRTIVLNKCASSAVLSRVFEVAIKQRRVLDEHPMFILHELAQHPNTPSETLSAILMEDDNSLILGRSYETFRNVGRHSNTSKDFLVSKISTTLHSKQNCRDWGQTKWYWFELGVAENENVEKYGLSSLIAPHQDEEVRAQLARNRYLSLERLQKLKMDSSLAVRVAVACNPNTDDESFAELIGTSGSAPHKLRFNGHYETWATTAALWESFRKGTESCPTFVDDAFSIDAGHGHRVVLAQYSKNPTTLADLVGMESGSLDSAILRNSSTPPEVLASFADSPYQELRWNVAGNPSTPLQALRDLSEDEDKSARMSVARNKSTPVDALNKMVESLGNDDDSQYDDLSITVLTHPKMPRRTAMNEIRRAADEGTFNGALLFHWRDELPVDLLTAASQSRETNARRSVSANSRLPVENLALLCTDPSLMGKPMPPVIALRESAFGGTMTNPTVQIAVDILSQSLSSDGIADI